MLVNIAPTYYDVHSGSGYFAGTNDGLVKVAGTAAVREIVCFDADNLSVIRRVWSLNNGHYLVPSLNPNRRYLVLCRDHKGEYRPQGWDYRLPATNATVAQQQALFASWQA